MLTKTLVCWVVGVAVVVVVWLSLFKSHQTLKYNGYFFEFSFQKNLVEQLPVYIPSVYMFSLYVSPRVGAFFAGKSSILFVINV